jgi:hypothetical protein
VIALKQVKEALIESQKDLDKFVSFFTVDANFALADVPLATGDSIHSAW